MKKLFAAIACLAVMSTAIMCNKKTGSKPTPLCTTCSVAVVQHARDSTGLYYFLPTAFTPNGDGINDDYCVISDSLNMQASLVTIWDGNGNGVYTGDLTQCWDGTDLTGKKCPSGIYNVNVKLVPLKGQTVNECTCVTILPNKGACIYTAGVTYYFADQINPDSGFVNPTNENICP